MAAVERASVSRGVALGQCAECAGIASAPTSVCGRTRRGGVAGSAQGGMGGAGEHWVNAPEL